MGGHICRDCSEGYEGTSKSVSNSRTYTASAGSTASLLEPLGLDGRLFKNHNAVTEHEDILDGLDYTEANAALDEIRKFSMNWLDNALKSEKVYSSKSIYSVRDITDKQEK